MSFDGWVAISCRLKGKADFRSFSPSQSLKIPTFTVFDADADQCVIPEDADEDTKKKRESQRKQHETDNRAILHLCSAESEAPIPSDDAWLSKVVMWKTRIGDVVEADFGEDTFRAAKEAVRKAEKLARKIWRRTRCFLGTFSRNCAVRARSPPVSSACAPRYWTSQKQRRRHERDHLHAGNLPQLHSSCSPGVLGLGKRFI